MLTLSFDYEAGETYERLLRELAGLTVRITPEEGEPFDATLIGPDVTAAGYGTVRVRCIEDDGARIGQAFSVDAKDIYIY